jgi:hypothetical protein
MTYHCILACAAGWILSVDSHHDQSHHAAAKAAHPHDPVLQAEHAAMLDLIKPADATHVAVRSGLWFQPETWKDGAVPGTAATVLIPRETTVVLDRVNKVILKAVRIDGTLQFAPDQNTGLSVDTIVVAPTGHLVIGTRLAPIAVDKRAEIVFADGGPIDAKWDPNLLSRGLISHGAASLYGAETTPFAALASAPRRGQTRLKLAQVPTNWRAGDHLVLTGTGLLPPALHPGEGKASELDSAGGAEDEELILQRISGTEVTVRPLTYDHVPPPGLSVYLANLSRNVIVRSENRRDLGRHGHVMFMHSPRVELHNAGFYDLGRTDKRTPIDDPRLDRDGSLIADTGHNPRGRYAVHFHRTGVDGRSTPIPVLGNAVVNSPGWGFVNHSSHIDFADNVAYNVVGTAFVTEAGDEIGSFRRNLAIRAIGSGEFASDRASIQDFGHEGDGFWFQGGGVVVEDNIAVSNRMAGFFYFLDGLTQDGLGKTRYRSANLPNPAWARGRETVPVGAVPIRCFRGNVAFACGTGYIVRFHSTGASKGNEAADGKVGTIKGGYDKSGSEKHGKGHEGSNGKEDNRHVAGSEGVKGENAQPAERVGGNKSSKCGNPGYRASQERDDGRGDLPLQRGVLEGGVVWNSRYGVELTYSSNVTLHKLHLLGNPQLKSSAGIVEGNEAIKGLRYENLQVEGWTHGILISEAGDHLISGGRYRNGVNILVPTLLSSDRSVHIANDVQFADTGGNHYDIYLEARFATLLEGDRGYRDPNLLFVPDKITYGDKQLYYPEQAADFIPLVRNASHAQAKHLGSVTASVPVELVEKTNRELWNRYGLAIGGAVSPDDAVTTPRIHALMGGRTTYSPVLTLNQIETSQLADHQLQAFDDSKRLVLDDRVDLHPGWNLVARRVQGEVRCFLVRGGERGGVVDKSGLGQKQK